MNVDLLDFCFEQDRKYIVEAETEQLENEINNEFKADLTMTVEENLIETIQSNNELYSSKENENKKDNTNNSTCIIENHLTNSLNLETYKTSKVKSNNRKNNKLMNANVKDKGLWEDIYGRRRNKDGNIIHDVTGYIPSGAQVVADGIHMDYEKFQILKKQLKGCLNRVAEHNIHIIANQVTYFKAK